MTWIRKLSYAWGLSSIGRALAWHVKGRGFDPRRLHHGSWIVTDPLGLWEHDLVKIKSP